MNILCIHGTFASGPTEGTAWWQKDGSLAKEISSKFGDSATIIPFSWDGKNRETSRRNAGEQLFKTVSQLERQETPYFIIAHSHGGLVVLESFCRAAKEGNKLSNLEKWITVGTPFLRFQPSKNPINRFNHWSKIFIFSGLISSAVYLFVNYYGLNLTSSLSSLFDLDYISFIIYFISPFIPFLFVLIFIYYQQQKYFWRYSSECISFLNENFRGRHVGFFHDQDEAIALLSGINGTKIDLFNYKYLAKFASFVASIIPIFIILAAVYDPTLVLRFTEYFGLGLNPEILQGSTSRYDSFGRAAGAFIFVLQLPLAHFNIAPYEYFGVPMVLLFFLMYFLAAISLSLVIFILFIIIGYLTSGGLNAAFKKNIVRQAFGSDQHGEEVSEAGSAPNVSWVTNTSLPKKVTDEITSIADNCFKENVEKIRQLIVSGLAKKSNWIALFKEYELTNELIHNSYFSSAMFRKTLVEAITNR